MARTSRKSTTVVQTPAVREVFKTAMYLRLSLEDNGRKDADSLENQRAVVEAFLVDKPYLELVDIYTDNGCTGTDFDRPDFQRMMRDIQSGKINCIVVKDLSRLGRNYVEVGNYLEKVFPFLDVRFIAVTDNYDSSRSDASDQLAASLKNLVNDAYAKDISKKICSSMKEKRERGDFLGAYAPYGYLRDPMNPNKLVIDPEIAPIVREIFKIRSTGIGIERLCRELNARNYPSPGRLRYERGIVTCNNKKGQDLPWNRHVLNDLLRNVVYIGNLAQGRSGCSLHQGIPFHWKNESEWVVVVGTHDPIISMELWEKVQTLTKKRSRETKESFGRHADLPKRQNPYGKVLRCADCGRVIKQVRTYSNKGTRDYYNYKCPQYIELGAEACPQKNIKAEKLDEAVLCIIKRQMEAFLDIQRLLKELSAQRDTPQRKRSLREQMTRVRTELEKKKKQRTQAYTDYKNGVLDQDDYLYAKEQYQKDIDALDQELYELQHAENRTVDVILGEKNWTEIVQQYYSATEVTAELIAATIEELHLHADSTLSVKFRYDTEFKELLNEYESIRREVA